MIILGLSGNGEFPLKEDSKENNWLAKSHDAAAVLIENGKVIAALEEERGNRIKHSGKAPINAIDWCLKSRGIKVADIDKIVIHCRENELDVVLTNLYILNKIDFKNGRDLINNVILRVFGYDYPKDKIEFVEHHMCHAANAYFMSGYDKSLILTIDGASPEGYAGYILSAKGGSWEVLDKITNDNSLGTFYTRIIMYLGYFQHDEYKVMGLAPYGNPKKYRPILKKIYSLQPEGKYKINTEYYGLLNDYIDVRRKGEPFTQDHKDLAAALQESLEIIVLHILEYYQKETGHTRVCLSGGVAHNCSMNGKILYSGLFEEMFVQPAAHDSGNALGGAMYVAKKEKETLQEIPHMFLGTNIGDDASIGNLLKKWDRLVTYTKEEDIIEKTSQIMAEGYVVGWVQGQSEFGPRALGNRSILADPRPAENKTIINSMVKKREGYRPFAPSILEEYLEEYYEVPGTKANLSFMNYVLQTKEEKKDILGAVTHVDGSARVQTVSKKTNEKYWRLIDSFRKRTGIPILLNTSFNNDVEPIVDTEIDALVCFLTTNIHYLVIGDYLIEKKEATLDAYMHLIPERPLVSCLRKSNGDNGVEFRMSLIDSKGCDKAISETLYQLLEKSDGKKTIKELLDESQLEDNEQRMKAVDEILQLWSKRVLKLSCR